MAAVSEKSREGLHLFKIEFMHPPSRAGPGKWFSQFI